MAITIEDLVADYTKVRGTLDNQIAWLEGGGRIVPGGASAAHANQATAEWLVKLRKFRLEYDEIIADLRRQAARG